MENLKMIDYDQEQEHYDYVMGAQWEAMNCYQEARTELSQKNARAKSELKDLLKEGRYVVTHHMDYYCRSTDAVVGELMGVYGSYKTREEAEAKLQELNQDSNPETGFLLHDPNPPPRVVYPGPEAPIDETIPF